MRVLILDDLSKSRIKKTIQYAQDNIIDIDTLKRLSEISKGGEVRTIGDNLNRTICLDFGFMVTFSIEEQPFGLTRHISISVDSGKLPAIAAVEMIMGEFGFDGCPLSDKSAVPERHVMVNEKVKYPVVDIVEKMESQPKSDKPTH